MLRLMGLILGTGLAFAAILVLVQPRLIRTVAEQSAPVQFPEATGRTEMPPPGRKAAAGTEAVRPAMPAVLRQPPSLDDGPGADGDLTEPDANLTPLPPLETPPPPATVVLGDDAPGPEDLANAATTSDGMATIFRAGPQNPSPADIPTDVGDTPVDDAPSVPDSEWYALWDPFHSRTSADAFAARLERLTGLDYKVVRLASARYQVAVAATTDEQRLDHLALIEEATGLRLVNSP